MDKQNPFVKALVHRGIPYVTACDIYLENLKPLVESEIKKAEVRGRQQMGEYVRHFFGKKIYLPGDKVGQYIILNRTKKTHGRLYRLRVRCTLCDGVLYKTTQHLKQPHRPCKENDITEKNLAAQTIESRLQSGGEG